MQPGDRGRLGAPQLKLKQVGEQVMIAEPGPPGVQRGHERVGRLQILQGPLPAAVAGQQVGQLSVDPRQDRRSQQQPPYLLVLPVQHLGQQVFGDRPLAAGELRRELFRILVSVQRQRRQPQPRRPPLGPLVQQSERPVRQPHPGRVEQRSRLGQ
jgi:hypothetical protein